MRNYNTRSAYWNNPEFDQFNERLWNNMVDSYGDDEDCSNEWEWDEAYYNLEHTPLDHNHPDAGSQMDYLDYMYDLRAGKTHVVNRFYIYHHPNF